MLLCVIYVFAPYLTDVVLGGGARGSAIFSSWQIIGGILVALTSPFLGAAADRLGHRKPALAVATAIMCVALFVQWWALPHEQGLPLWVIEIAAILAGIAYSWTDVLHNSMLTLAARPSQVSQVSGLGLALGNAGGLLLLLFVLFAFALPGRVHLPGIPEHPLFGLNPAAHEVERVVMLLVPAWFIVFALPLFFFTPDRNPSGEKIAAAFRDGVKGVLRTLTHLSRDYRNTARFLFARMLYVDGTTTVVTFAGVYAKQALRWDSLEMVMFGVVLSTFAVFGGFFGAVLDERFGAKRAVAIAVVVTFLCLLAQVSMSPTQMFFFIPADPLVHVWNGPIFRTAPELAYLGASTLIAISITAAYSSSRALMAQLAPEGMEGEIFGLYALSSAATAWLGPLLITVFTALFHSFRIGFGSIGSLLIAGFVMLMFVKPPARAAA